MVRTQSLRSSSTTESELPLRMLGGLAQQTKLAVANARSFDDLVATFNATVQSLTSAVRGHDRDLSPGHEPP